MATPIYKVTSEDRVYQGMTISFDFHIEEIWPAWVAGATLIAGPTIDPAALTPQETIDRWLVPAHRRSGREQR